MSIGFGAILLMLATIMVQWLRSIEAGTKRLLHLKDEYYESTLVFKMADATQKRALSLFRMIVLDNKEEQLTDYWEMIELEKSFSHPISEHKYICGRQC